MRVYALCSYIILTTEDTVAGYVILSAKDGNCVSAVQNDCEAEAVLPFCLTCINVNRAVLGILSRMNLMWIRYKSKSACLLS